MSNLKASTPIRSKPPSGDLITDYDRAHFATYLVLLYAAGEGKSEDEMARNILNIDPDEEPVRARHIVSSHLARARWLAESGCYQLLEE